MHIRDWPAAERPREKLLARGAGALSDAELLAIFLGSGLRGRDAVTTARELLSTQGGLRALLERPPKELRKLRGLGPARVCALTAALELGQRLLQAELERGAALNDPQAAGRYFAQRLRSLPHEVFAALFLDTRHRVIAFEELFQGTLDGAEVHPREVVRRALGHNAAAVIVRGYVVKRPVASASGTLDSTSIAGRSSREMLHRQMLQSIDDYRSSKCQRRRRAYSGASRLAALRARAYRTTARRTANGSTPIARHMSTNSMTSKRRSPRSTLDIKVCVAPSASARPVWVSPAPSRASLSASTSARYSRRWVKSGMSGARSRASQNLKSVLE